MLFEPSLEFAKELDRRDELRSFREKFFIPPFNGRDSIYLCGNSLGLQPKSARIAVEQELEDWKNLGVKGHVEARNPWLYYHKQLKPGLSYLVGAKPHEVNAMGSLTSNLHLMMVSFFNPEGRRKKIMIDSGAFPSDYYAVQSQLKFHNLDSVENIIQLHPRTGEYLLRTEDIIEKIEKHADEISLVLLEGVNYYTGQVPEIEKITRVARNAGAKVGFDLAHAIGNINLQLHDWDVDFACWCSYKYLNSGPGGVGGIYIHEKHAKNPDISRFEGWWGNKEEERFLMKKEFNPMYGADGWQLSNSQIFNKAIHKAALDIFIDAGIINLQNKSSLITGFLYFLLNTLNKDNELFEIITPEEPSRRGCQLSVLFKKGGNEVFKKLSEEGIVVDWREPDVMRITPVPLYNSFEDVYLFFDSFKNSLKG